MKRWIAAGLVAAGCYRSSPPQEPPAPPRPAFEEPRPASARYRPPPRARSAMGEVIEKLSELTDEMCACADKACADAVQHELTRWSAEVAQQFQHEQPTAEELDEVSQVTERLSSCMMAAMGYPPPPPHPGP